MKLWEIDEEVEYLLLSLSEEEEDDKIDHLEARLHDLEMERDQKLQNIWRIIRNSSGLVEMLRAEERRLADKRKREERKIEKLKAYVANFGGIERGQKWEKDGQGFTWRKSQRVTFDEDFTASNLPPTYQRVTIEADKQKLKESLKNGTRVEGVRLEDHHSLAIL